MTMVLRCAEDTLTNMLGDEFLDLVHDLIIHLSGLLDCKLVIYLRLSISVTTDEWHRQRTIER